VIGMEKMDKQKKEIKVLRKLVQNRNREIKMLRGLLQGVEKLNLDIKEGLI
jgi:hypothetical protein